MDASLRQLMCNEGFVLTVGEEIKRADVIEKIKAIVSSWIIIVKHSLRNQSLIAHATILPFGSYGLNAHNPDSDIDALCVAPWFASMEKDFFEVLYDMLARRWEVTDLHCIKDAKVPLMRFKFEGISIDMPYARLLYVPEDMNLLLDLCFLNVNIMSDETEASWNDGVFAKRNILQSVPDDEKFLNLNIMGDETETSWNSFDGVFAKRNILQSVPDVEKFRHLLRCVKSWAKRRGVYGKNFGFFGGIHLAVLAAFVCRKNPNARTLADLVSTFFHTFAVWRWPEPVRLYEKTGITDQPNSFYRMPIQSPACSGQEYCHSNMTVSTFRKIKGEFQRVYGGVIFRESEVDWNYLFQPFPYTRSYRRFVKIFVSASGHEQFVGWVGRVKSRFHWLLVKLEQHQEDQLGFCDPNPTEYFNTETQVVFYWGLLGFARNEDLYLGHLEQQLMNNLCTGYGGCPGQVVLSIVQESTPSWMDASKGQLMNHELVTAQAEMMSHEWDTALAEMRKIENCSRYRTVPSQQAP